MLIHIQTCLSMFWTLREKINSKICSDQLKHVQDILRHVQMCCRHIQTYSRYVNTLFHTCSRHNTTWYTTVKTCSINVETCQNISIACLDMLQTCSVFPKYPDMFLACWYMSDIFQACSIISVMSRHSPDLSDTCFTNVPNTSRLIQTNPLLDQVISKYPQTCTTHAQTYWIHIWDMSRQDQFMYRHSLVSPDMFRCDKKCSMHIQYVLNT